MLVDACALLADGGDPSAFVLLAVVVLAGPVLLAAALGRLVLRGRPGAGTYFCIWLFSAAVMGLGFDRGIRSGNVFLVMLGHAVAGAVVGALLCLCYQAMRGEPE